MDRLTLFGDGLLDRHVGRQLLELHLDEVERLVRYPLVGGRHCGNRIADITNFLGCERLLVLTDRQDAELDRQRCSGCVRADADAAECGRTPSAVRRSHQRTSSAR